MARRRLDPDALAENAMRVLATTRSPFVDPPPRSPLVAGCATRIEENQLRQLVAAHRTFGLPLDWLRPDIAERVRNFPREA